MIVRVNNSAYGDEVEHFESVGRLRLKCDCTRAETTFRLSAKRTSPFKSAGASVQLNTGSRDVRINGSNAGYTMFRGSVRVLATHSIRQFPLHFPPYPLVFQLDSTTSENIFMQTMGNMYIFNDNMSNISTIYKFSSVTKILNIIHYVSEAAVQSFYNSGKSYCKCCY